MWSRIALKDNAKRIMKKNYWWIVLVALILGIAMGEGIPIKLDFNINRSGLTANMGLNNGNSGSYFDEIMGNTNDYDDYLGDNFDFFSIVSQYKHSIKMFWNRNFSFVNLTMVFGIFCIVLLVGVALQCFLLAPLEVGCKRWFLKNRTEKPDAGEMAYAFKQGYMNVVKVMFCMNLFITLWSLLFVIPGIIKSYEYRMIPYLLAENPEMDMNEAFSRSKAMMTGNKWETFVLDLSFLGWKILSALTYGVLNLLYVSPYINLTNAELYVALCSSGSGSGEQYRY